MATKKHSDPYSQFLLPSCMGAVTAWVFSGGSASLGLTVFAAVWIGSWIGYKLLIK